MPRGNIELIDFKKFISELETLADDIEKLTRKEIRLELFFPRIEVFYRIRNVSYDARNIASRLGFSIRQNDVIIEERGSSFSIIIDQVKQKIQKWIEEVEKLARK